MNPKENLCYTAFDSTQGSSRLQSTARSVTLTSASVRVSFTTTAQERLVVVSMRNFGWQLSCYSSCLSRFSLHRMFNPWFRPTKKRLAQLLWRLPRETCLDGAERFRLRMLAKQPIGTCLAHQPVLNAKVTDSS